MNYKLGIAYKLTNLFLFSCISLLFHYVTPGLDLIQVSLIMGVVPVIILFPWMYKNNQLALPTSGRDKYLYRGVFNLIGKLTWFYALTQIGANNTSAISYSIPIMTLLLAVVICHEKLDFKSLIAVGTALIGAYIIKPYGEGGYNFGVLAALFSSFMWAAHDITCKLQGSSEHPVVQSFWVNLITFILNVPFVIYNGWHPIAMADLAIITLLGVISAFNIIVLFQSFRYAPVKVLMPFSYLRLVFMAVGSYVLFGETVANNTVVGSLIIISASIYLFQHKVRNKTV